MGQVLVVGSLNMDFVVDVEKMPLPGETVLGKKFTLVPGGKGANQAYAIGKLGSNVSMLGLVGNDEYGKRLKDNLNSVNVNTSSIGTTNDSSTGCAFINVDKTGENSITVIQGANKLLSEEIIDKNINLIDESDIIVMQLEVPIKTILYISKIAKEKGKIVILDPAPARNDLPDELFKNVDIIKPNETELQTLTGVKVQNKEDVVNAAKHLIEKGVETVIVTLGGKGSILVTKEKCKEFHALDVKVIDTTAAGDSFTAALTKYLLENKTIEEAIQFGHLVSSIVVTKKGAQTSIPNNDEIENFIKSYNKGE